MRELMMTMLMSDWVWDMLLIFIAVAVIPVILCICVFFKRNVRQIVSVKFM